MYSFLILKYLSVFAHEDTINFLFSKYVLLLCEIFSVFAHGMSF
jgi:hypothetical protein